MQCLNRIDVGTLKQANAIGRFRAAGRRWAATTLILVILLNVACQEPCDHSQFLADRQRLQDEIERQRNLLEEKEAQIEGLFSTTQSLRKLDGERSLDDLIHVDRIEIDRHSAGYDTNGDGLDDGVRVYLRLYDQFGGVIRASGQARMKLFDLSREEDGQLVAEGDWDAKALTERWYGRFMTSHYSLDIPWRADAKPIETRTITVLASFTDLLSGRTFQDQKPVTIQLGAVVRQDNEPTAP